MKTVILTLNSKYIHSALAPWYLLAAVKEKEADAPISVLESTINRTVEETLEEICALKPRILACSCYIWNIDKILELAESYKAQCPESHIVLGGPEVGYRPEDVLIRYPFVDAVISGEGEMPFAALYQSLKAGGGYEGIEGVSYRRMQGIYIAEPYVTNAEPPDPYTNAYFDQLGGRIAYIEGSRGCPFRCAFCLSGRCGTVRFFGLNRIKRDIVRLSNSGARTVKFVDRTFNANRRRALDIWNFIIENSGKLWPVGVCFHFEIAGDLLDEECLTLLRKAPRGVIQVEIGLQSFNPRTLEAVNRKTNVNKLCDNIISLVKCGNVF